MVFKYQMYFTANPSTTDMTSPSSSAQAMISGDLTSEPEPLNRYESNNNFDFNWLKAVFLLNSSIFCPLYRYQNIQACSSSVQGELVLMAVAAMQDYIVHVDIEVEAQPWSEVAVPFCLCWNHLCHRPISLWPETSLHAGQQLGQCSLMGRCCLIMLARHYQSFRMA